MFFMLLMYVFFSHKELLCFHKPLLLVSCDLLKRENIGERSVKKAAKTCFDDFFFPCDNWKTLFFLKVYRYREIISTAILSISLKQVF